MSWQGSSGRRSSWKRLRGRGWQRKRRRGLERERVTDELARKLREALELEEAERQRLAEEEEKRMREAEEAAKKEKKRKVTGERSKKPTMAREWRKLKQREKAEAEARVASPPPPMEPIEPVVPLPPRAKYVKPVFAENECYDSRHNSFLKGDWPHNNKKGIPTPSELAEAGFFFIGPGDYCRCYQCGLEQMCWDPFEDPWIRHGFLAPDCSYVERIKGRDWVEAVSRGEF